MLPLLVGSIFVLLLACFPAPSPAPTPLPPPTPKPLVFQAQRVLGDLKFPTSFAFAPDGRLFFAERFTGRVRVVHKGRLLPHHLVELEVVPGPETGLLGLALDPRFPQEPYVYLYYTYRAEGAIYNRVARIREAQGRGGSLEVLLDRVPAAGIHNGGVLKFGPDGKLYISTGDATMPQRAQDPGSLAGKILRINPDGSIPQDNPFPGSPVFSLGHRNVFGLAFHPGTGTLVITENGPTTDDEVNVVRPGKNYGWPVVLGMAPGSPFVNPVLTFTPNIAPTQAVFYRGDKLPPEYQGNLFFGAWNTGSIHRVVLREPELDAVVRHQVVFTLGPRGIVGLGLDPEGYLYFSTPDALYRLLAEAGE